MPAEGILVLFETVRDFYNMFGLTVSQLSKRMFFHSAKYATVLGTYVHDDKNPGAPAHILLG